MQLDNGVISAFRLARGRTVAEPKWSSTVIRLDRDTRTCLESLDGGLRQRLHLLSSDPLSVRAASADTQELVSF